MIFNFGVVLVLRNSMTAPILFSEYLTSSLYARPYKIIMSDENVEIRKLTLHLNDRPVNILAPVKVPKPKYTAARAIDHRSKVSQRNAGPTKKERQEKKAKEESMALEEMGKFYGNAREK